MASKALWKYSLLQKWLWDSKGRSGWWVAGVPIKGPLKNPLVHQPKAQLKHLRLCCAFG